MTPLFQKLASGVAVEPLMAQLSANPDLWDRDVERLSDRGPHHQTHDIWLRYRDKAPHVASGDWSGFADPHVPIWYPAAEVLSATRPMLDALMAATRGEMLGGVLIYSVPAGAEILVHTDTGWHPEYFAKFNVALQSQAGCAFYYPDHGQEMCAETGDLHWFRNTVPHGVRNTSDCDQLILTACIRTPDFRET